MCVIKDFRMPNTRITGASSAQVIRSPGKVPSSSNCRRSPASVATAHRQGCRLQAEGASRAATRICSSAARGTGSDRYARQLKRDATNFPNSLISAPSPHGLDPDRDGTHALNHTVSNESMRKNSVIPY